MHTHANGILRNSRVPAANPHSCRPFSGRTKSHEDKSAVEGGRAAEGHTGPAGEWHAEEVGRSVSQTLRASLEEPAQQFHPVRASLQEQAKQRMAMAGMSARERERELLSRMRSSIPGGRDGVYTGALYPGLSLRYRGFLDSRRSVQPGPRKILKSLTSLTVSVVISYSLKSLKISYANGRVSVRIFYKNNLISSRF
jgi:hypothetical protein